MFMTGQTNTPTLIDFELVKTLIWSKRKRDFQLSSTLILVWLALLKKMAIAVKNQISGVCRRPIIASQGRFTLYNFCLQLSHAMTLQLELYHVD